MTPARSVLARPVAGLSAIALLIAVGYGCARKPQPSPAERVQIAEWQAMVSAARVPSALAELRSRATAGMVAAQSALGQALSSAPDPGLASEGLGWLRLAAKANDASALLALGKLELSGTSLVPLDYVAANSHLVAAAAQHDPRADYYLGIMARNGYGRPADHAAAARELSIAAAQGIPQALFLLANAYRNGDGVPRDEQHALQLYEQAAEQDHPESIQTLAMAYQNGELGLPRDPIESQGQLLELQHAQKDKPSLP